MDHRRPLLLAIAILFGLPLLLFMSFQIESPLVPDPWGGGLLGAIYLSLALCALQFVLKAEPRKKPVLDPTCRYGAEEELARRDDRLSDYKKRVATQRAVIEKKNERIAYLEGQIKQLSSHPQADQPAVDQELEEVLAPLDEDLIEWEEDPIDYDEREVRTKQEANDLLEQCLTKAETLPTSPRTLFPELSFDNYQIDLRRLFDLLRHETAAAIVIYSKEEEKLIFASDLVKTLFGWSPDRFKSDFPQLVKTGLDEWQEAMTLLSPGKQTALRLILQTKSGDASLVHAYFGVVAKGTFAGLSIGILFA